MVRVVPLDITIAYIRVDRMSLATKSYLIA